MSKSERFDAIKRLATIISATKPVKVDTTVFLAAEGEDVDERLAGEPEQHKIKIMVTPSSLMRVASKFRMSACLSRVHQILFLTKQIRSVSEVHTQFTSLRCQVVSSIGFS